MPVLVLRLISGQLVMVEIKFHQTLTSSLSSTAAGQQGKSKILGIMNKYLNERRGKVLKTNLPKTEIIEVPQAKRANLIGAGGFRLKKVYQKMI